MGKASLFFSVALFEFILANFAAIIYPEGNMCLLLFFLFCFVLFFFFFVFVFVFFLPKAPVHGCIPCVSCSGSWMWAAATAWQLMDSGVVLRLRSEPGHWSSEHWPLTTRPSGLAQICAFWTSQYCGWFTICFSLTNLVSNQSKARGFVWFPLG